MPEQVGDVRVSIKSEGKDGKIYSNPRTVGRLMRHSNGSQYIEFDGYFDWAKYLQSVGSMFFMSVVPPKKREPGAEG